MPELTPLDDNRQEHFLNGEDLEPITRREHFYAGREGELPEGHQEPETREEWFIKKYRGGGGGDITVESLSVTSNGTYTAPSGKAYSPVEVDVPLPQNAYLLKSVANLPQAIASFNDGEEMVMPTLKVAIEPQQEGSGDPSPTNIRPISGWSSVNVVRADKNLAENVLVGGSIGGTGVIGTASGYSMAYGKVKKGVTYTITTNDSQLVGGFFENEPQIGTQSYDDSRIVQASKTFTAPIDGYIAFRILEGYTQYQLEIGLIATSYSPYAGTTYTIDLDGTRYGGEVDVVNGVLTVDRAYVDLGSLDWTLLDSQDGKNRFISGVITNMKSMNTRTMGIMCSCYVPNIGGGAYDNGGIYNGALVSQLIIVTSKYSDATTFKTSLSGQFAIVELATPITVQLTPTQVKSLLGSNNVWADTGDITDAEYFSKEV